MMKKIFTLLLIIIAVSTLVFYLIKSEKLTIPFIAENRSIKQLIVDPSLLETAKNKLPGFFEIANGDPEGFGIDPNSSIDKTQLLPPFPTYFLNISKDKKINSDNEILSFLEPSGGWNIPVDWGNGPGTFIYATKEGNNWNMTKLGGRNTLLSLLSALGAISKNTETSSKLMLMQKSVYFINIPDKSTNLIISQSNRGLVGIVLVGPLEPKDQSETPIILPAKELLNSIFNTE